MSLLNQDSKTSTIILSSLPAVIKEDPDNALFLDFLKLYFEWLETEYPIRDLQLVIDIDKTYSELLDKFSDVFLPYFPQIIAADKRKLIKIVRLLYQSSGIEASFIFLFRALYDEDINIYITRDSVLRASGSKWIQSKYIKVSEFTPTSKIFNFTNYKIFGETSKSSAIIENSVEKNGLVYIYISNINGVFLSNEWIKIVDVYNRDVYFLNGVPLVNSSTYPIGSSILRAKIYNEVLSVIVDNAGRNYNIGDPVVVSGSPIIRDTAIVSGTQTLAVVEYINLIGKTSILELANSKISNTYSIMSVSNSVTSANTLLSGLDWDELYTYPIENKKLSNYSYIDNSLNTHDVKSLGILGPIIIKSGGKGYKLTDTISFSQTLGYGAYAKIDTIGSVGDITSVVYYDKDNYILGGTGYDADNIPEVSVVSSTGSDAVLFIRSILNDENINELRSNIYGRVTSIAITSNNNNYVAPPAISLRVMDIAVSNVIEENVSNSIVYQGLIGAKTYAANVDSISLIAPSIYSLRVYDYTGSINANAILFNLSDTYTQNLDIEKTYNSNNFSSGLNVYGSGTAKAHVALKDIVHNTTGFYFDDDGKLDSHCVLEGKKFNDFTYIISAEENITDYKYTVKNIVHPAGSQLFGNQLLKANNDLVYTPQKEFEKYSDIGYINAEVRFSSGNTILVNSISTSSIQEGVYEFNPLTFNIFFPLLNSNDNKIIKYILPVLVTDTGLSNVNLNAGDTVSIGGLYTIIDSTTSNTITTVDSKIFNYSNIAYGYNVANAVYITTYTDANNFYGINTDDIFAINDEVSINLNPRTGTIINIVGNNLYINNTITSNTTLNLISVKKYNGANSIITFS